MLVDSTAGSPLPNCIPQYAKKIKEKARARQLTSSIGLAGEKLKDGQDIQDVKRELVLEMEQIEGDKMLSEDKSISDVVMPTLAAMADRLSGDDSKKGMRTGISMLDGTTTGINAGELWMQAPPVETSRWLTAKNVSPLGQQLVRRKPARRVAMGLRIRGLGEVALRVTYS